MYKSALKHVASEWNKQGHSLTLPQYKILYSLEREGSQNISQLAHSLCITPSAVIAVTDQLVNEGLIRKERAENDRRVVHVHLTDQGKDRARQMQSRQKQFMQLYFNRLSDEDIQHLKRILASMTPIKETNL
jgi:DNA-binding MarR family transcriptional regulator